MRRVGFSVIAAALIAGAPVRAADGPLMLEPSSPWVADFKDESCAIRRSFSGEGQQVTVELDDFLLGDGFDVVIAGVTLDRRPGVVSAGFEPDEDFPERTDVVAGEFANRGHGIIYSGNVLRKKDIEAMVQENEHTGLNGPLDVDLRTRREAEITGLLVKGAFQRDLRFNTGALTKPMAVMRQCIDELVRSKGMGPTNTTVFSRLIKPKDQMRWAQRALSYPTDMVRKGISATVRLRLLIDETGKPIACATQPRGEDKSFDKAACDGALKYAEFTPALDAAGRPVKAYWSTTTTYSLH